MKKVYFKDKANPLWSRVLTSGVMHAVALIAPKKSLEASYRYLVDPHSKRAYTWTNVSPSKRLHVKTRLGKVQGYFFDGGTKQALLTHGWGDTAKSFETYIQALLAEGFSVWCFDHIGHGYSEGKVSHLFGFIEGLQGMIKHIEETEKKPIDLLLSHSMGGAAVMNLEASYLAKRKVVIVSIPVKMFESMFQDMKHTGIPAKILVRLLEDISLQYGRDWKALKPVYHAQKLGSHTLVIHDKKDRFCPWENVAKMINKTKAVFVSTEGLGHRGVLKNAGVIENICKFAKKQ